METESKPTMDLDEIMARVKQAETVEDLKFSLVEILKVLKVRQEWEGPVGPD